jgi:hypothetical protein
VPGEEVNDLSGIFRLLAGAFGFQKSAFLGGHGTSIPGKRRTSEVFGNKTGTMSRSLLYVDNRDGATFAGRLGV